ncbi:MAG: hypothetical protein AB7P18_25770 [Candidatus Binatia bacterium]
MSDTCAPKPNFLQSIDKLNLAHSRIRALLFAIGEFANELQGNEREDVCTLVGLTEEVHLSAEQETDILHEKLRAYFISLEEHKCDCH